jgi:hypothetical protein
MAQSKPRGGMSRAPSLGQSVASQGGAAWRGLVDSASLGLSDQIHAVATGFSDKYRGGEFSRGYQRQAAIERAQDAEDERRYAVARTIGQVAGAIATPPVARGAALATRAVGGAIKTGVTASKGARGATLAAEGVAKGRAASSGAKAAKPAPKPSAKAKPRPKSGPGIDRPRERFGTVLSPGEQLKLMAMGAGVSVGAQAVGDGMRSTPGDLGAAAFGGALQTIKLPTFELARGLGAAVHGTKVIPTAATASAAAMESLAADILNGRARPRCGRRTPRRRRSLGSVWVSRCQGALPMASRTRKRRPWASGCRVVERGSEDR